MTTIRYRYAQYILVGACAVVTSSSEAVGAVGAVAVAVAVAVQGCQLHLEVHQR